MRRIVPDGALNSQHSAATSARCSSPSCSLSGLGRIRFEATARLLCKSTVYALNGLRPLRVPSAGEELIVWYGLRAFQTSSHGHLRPTRQ